MQHRFRSILSWAALVALFTVSAAAQFEKKFTMTNPDADAHFFGHSAAGLGDVNGDGFPDYAVGTGGHVNHEGFVKVYSGEGGLLLYTLTGPHNNSAFGRNIANAGDVNNDGVDDLIVSAERYDAGALATAGRVEIYSGVNGALLHQFDGSLAGEKIGVSVCGAGDMDADGHADFAYANETGPTAGISQVFIRSGADGSLIHTLTSNQANSEFGASIAGVGDVNNDGTDDLCVGSPGYTFGTGRTTVYSGTDGTVIHSNNSSFPNRRGESCAALGDINADGHADYAVGVPTTDNGAIVDAGRVVLMSGSSGSNLAVANGNQAGLLFGSVMSGVDDMNGDGIRDLMVGSPLSDANGNNSGRVWFLSGADLSGIEVMDGNAQNRFGFSVAGVGDVNQDGASDFLIGATHRNGLHSNSGEAYIFLGDSDRTEIPDRLDGGGGSDKFGAKVAFAGDVNGDGHEDFIVAAASNDANGSNAGQVRIYSGKHGGLIHTLYGEENGSQFGSSVAGTGDVNNDGFDDVVVGARLKDGAGTASGRVYVYSGIDAALLFTFDGVGGLEQLGHAVAGAGDVNNDGTPDIIAGAPLRDEGGVTNSGVARVYSGSDGSLLYTFAGANANDQLGYSVAGIGDVNGDGHDDVAAGARLYDNGGLTNCGAVYVYSGLDGSLLHLVIGAEDLAQMGFSLAAAGDVNGDSIPDMIAGAPKANSGNGDFGQVRVISGSDGAFLHTVWGVAGSDFGYSVAGGGDYTGDGVGDFVVGDPGGVFDSQVVGSATVLNGATGARESIVYGENLNDRFGESVSGLHDFNSDGLGDFLVGAENTDFHDTNAGSLYYFEGKSGISVYPYHEDFNAIASNGNDPISTNEVPSMWLNDSQDSGSTIGADWYPRNGAVTDGVSGDHSIDSIPDGNFMQIEDGADPAAQIDLYSPVFELSGMTSPQVVFWHFGFNRSNDPLNNENFLQVDITSPGGDFLATLMGPIGHLPVDGWVKWQFDVSSFIGERIRIRFRGDTLNEGVGGSEHKIAIDDFLIYDADVHKGQVPVNGLAEFNINGGLTQIANAGLPGAVDAFATTGGPLTLEFTGMPNQGVTCLFGPLNPAHSDFGAPGVIDIGFPDANFDGIPEGIFILADGISPVGIADLFYNTGPAGTGTITYTMPNAFAPGLLTTFQCIMASPLGLKFSNTLNLIVQ